MISRLAGLGIELVKKSVSSGVIKNAQSFTKTVSGTMCDSITLLSQRVKNLNLFYSRGTRNHLFNFSKKGEITVRTRTYGSDDLKFLSHIKNGHYEKPIIYPHGSYPCTKNSAEYSNKLAKEIINENEHFIDGYRYCGPNAKFDETGKNISRFSNSGQEIVVIDRMLDKTLVKTIETFKNRINNKNLTDEQKMDKLMSYVDEIFSVDKSGSKIEELVSIMHANNGLQKEVLLGDIINSGAGVCRHRSILTKLLADEVGLKSRMVQGYFGGGGHAWNEIITKNETYLFDAMHGNIFNVTSPAKNIVPQTFDYKITNPLNADKIIPKYFDVNSTTGVIYRSLRHKIPIKTSEAIVIPSGNGYLAEPLSDKVMVNGKKIFEKTVLNVGDFVNIKDIGFQII